MRYKIMSSIVFSMLVLMSLVSCGGSVDVTGSSNNSATSAVTLTWDAPTTYTDTTSLTPAGYHIYYGPYSSYYTNVVDVYGGNVTEYTIDNLFPGTYYIAVTVYDVDGNESDFAQPEIIASI